MRYSFFNPLLLSSAPIDRVRLHLITDFRYVLTLGNYVDTVKCCEDNLIMGLEYIGVDYIYG